MAKFDAPRRKGTPGFFFTQADDRLACPTCIKLRRQCLTLNPDDTYDYRRRPLRDSGEWLIPTFHEEIGTVNLIVRRAIVHGIEREIPAEPVLCAAGLMVYTGWSSGSIRSYGAYIPGRVRAARRPERQLRCRDRWHAGGMTRRPPDPLLVNSQSVVDWLFRFVEPIPANSSEFARLILILARRNLNGEAFDDVLAGYADELKGYLTNDHGDGGDGHD